MATLPTAEDAAKHLLSIFRSAKVGPLDELTPLQVVQPFWRAPWRQLHFGQGVELAMKLGWIEETGSGGYRITNAGLAAT